MEKITYKKFYYLMSAMLFMSDDLDKDQELNDMYTDYKQQHYDDPVEFAREWFQDCGPDSHEWHIRPSFTAHTWAELQPV